MNRVAAPAVSKRIPELDGLRGIAILMVVSFHYLNNQLVHATSGAGRWLGFATSFGWIGVDLFFVLSGFLIGSILIANRNSPNFFSTFYIRRIVRIIPNYYLLLVLAILIVSIPFFSPDSFLAGGSDVIPWWSYFLMLHNIFMAHRNSLGNEAISVTWSIGIEEQFYLVFPLIVWFIREKWLLWVLILAIVLAPLVRMQYSSWIPQYVLLPCRMDSIAFGALVAYVNRHFSLAGIVRKKIAWIAALLVIDCSICAYLFLRYGDLGFIKNTLFAFFFAGCLALALTYKQSLYAAVLRNKLLMWIGTISYSFYLFHYLVLGIFQYVFNGYLGLALTNLRDSLVSIAALLFSIGFSWLVYKKLETPFVQWGKRFKY